MGQFPSNMSGLMLPLPKKKKPNPYAMWPGSESWDTAPGWLGRGETAYHAANGTLPDPAGLPSGHPFARQPNLFDQQAQPAGVPASATGLPSTAIVDQEFEALREHAKKFNSPEERAKRVWGGQQGAMMGANRHMARPAHGAEFSLENYYARGADKVNGYEGLPGTMEALQPPWNTAPTETSRGISAPWHPNLVIPGLTPEEQAEIARAKANAVAQGVMLDAPLDAVKRRETPGAIEHESTMTDYLAKAQKARELALAGDYEGYLAARPGPLGEDSSGRDGNYQGLPEEAKGRVSAAADARRDEKAKAQRAVAVRKSGMSAARFAEQMGDDLTETQLMSLAAERGQLEPFMKGRAEEAKVKADAAALPMTTAISGTMAALPNMTPEQQARALDWVKGLVANASGDPAGMNASGSGLPTGDPTPAYDTMEELQAASNVHDILGDPDDFPNSGAYLQHLIDMRVARPLAEQLTADAYSAAALAARRRRAASSGAVGSVVQGFGSAAGRAYDSGGPMGM